MSNWVERLAAKVLGPVPDEDGPDVTYEQISEALQVGGLGYLLPQANGPDYVIKADTNSKQARLPFGIGEATPTQSRALFHDPYGLVDWAGWRERPGHMAYDTLRSMSYKNTVIAAVLALRINQVAGFSRPQQGKYDRGYKILLRDRRDMKRSMTDAESKQAAEIERLLETTAVLLPGEKVKDRHSFKMMIKQWVRDQLTYDQACIELIRDRRGRISRFNMLPSDTIRPAVADVEHWSVQDRRERVAYVQIFQNTVISEFTSDDLIFSIMNPRSDLVHNQFGFSPLEQLIQVVTSWLYGLQYNASQFTQGSLQKGLINIKGAIPNKQLRAFRRQWYSMVTGVANAWRTPILNSEDVQWLNMQTSNREMEFAAWMDWLTKLTTALYLVDPIEINFQFGNTGQKQGLTEGSQEYKFDESKDKGLRPLLDHIADELNRSIVWEINPDFEFGFVGLDVKAESKDREAGLAEVKGFKTINEVRAERDIEPLPDGKGDVILDSTYAQLAGGEGGGDGGGGPFDEWDDGDGDDDEDGSKPNGNSNGGSMPGSRDEQSDQADDVLQMSRPKAGSLRKARVHRRRRGSMVDLLVDLPEE